MAVRSHCGMHGQKKQGLPEDMEHTARYDKLSADQGDAKAQNRYGLCLSKGEGVAQDVEEAAR